MSVLLSACTVAFAACVLAGVGVWILVDARASRGEIAARTRTMDAADPHARPLARVRAAAAQRFDRTRIGEHVDDALSSAGLEYSALDTLAATVCVALVAFVVMQRLLGFVMAALGAAGVVAGARAWLNVKRRKRAEAFVTQLPELATLLANAARAGLSLRAAIDHAAGELGDPAATELLRTAEFLRLGQPIEDALEDLEARLPSRELGVLVSTLVIQHSVGGRLASSLSDMANVLEDRQELRRELRTLTAQSVYTGYLAAALGVGSLLLTNLISPGVLDAMLASWGGRAALAVAAALYTIGILLIRRTARVEI